MASESVGGTQTVERAMSLLACFTEEAGELRVSELCALTGLGQSTVSRMMSSLDRMRFVVQDERTGLYRLGPAAVSLGTIALNGSPIFRASRQIAQNLAHRLGIGVNVAELSGFTLYYLCNFEGRSRPSRSRWPAAPRRCTPRASARRCCRACPPPASTSTSRTRRSGSPRTRSSTATPWRSPSTRPAAAGTRPRSRNSRSGAPASPRPIRNRAGEIVAGLSASGPLSVLDLQAPHQEIALQVIEAADEISVALGYSPSHQTALRPSPRSDLRRGIRRRHPISTRHWRHL